MLKRIHIAAIPVLILVTMATVLHWQGRLWVCAYPGVYLWAGDIWSEHNSQHFADPYSFTHVLHGVIFCGIISWLGSRIYPPQSPRMRGEGRLCAFAPLREVQSIQWPLILAVALEAIWEIIENSRFVIERYREATVSLGYEGDTILNSMADVLFCALGFLLARRLGLRKSIVFFVAVELVLLVWIRDNLTLNIVMLIHPIEALKAWQVVH